MHITLSHIVTSNLPFEPTLRNTRIASSTRTVSDTEMEYEPQEQLHGVVYDCDLAQQLTESALAWAHTVPIDTKNPAHCYWLGRVDPRFTHYPLSPVINSEQDAREWALTTVMRPAIGITRAARDKVLRLNQDPRSCIPFIASSPGERDKPIPDGILSNKIESWIHLRPDRSEETECVYEFKGGNALNASIFDDLALTAHVDTSKPAIVVPFVWPSKGQVLTKQTKILVQIYCQMRKHRVNHAILSSFHSTFFLYLGGENGNILFVSSPYGTSDVLLATFAWTAHALNLIPKPTFELPELDMFCVRANTSIDWWSESTKKNGAVGQAGLDIDFALRYRSEEFGQGPLVHRPAIPTTPTQRKQVFISDDDPSDDEKTPVAMHITTRVNNPNDTEAGPSNKRKRLN